MTWRGPMVDAAAATVATVVTLAILAEGGLGSPDAASPVLDDVGLLLALASSVPLAFARRWPGAVFTVSAIATIVLLHLRYPLDVPIGPLYSGYVLAFAWGGAGPLRRGLAVVGVVAYVPVIMVTVWMAGVNVWAVTTELSTWGMAMVGVWLAGDRTRLRRAELAAAEERAARTEREAERENRLAAAEERTRIARELHDSAGHAINVILVQAGAARLLHERDPAASLHAISTVEDVARATIVDIDRMVHALRSTDGAPVPADPAALEELLDHHRRSGLRLATTYDGERRPLPRSVAWAAYRILQEALTNAARHGGGSAEVMVGFGPHAMEIAVSNPTVGAGSAGGPSTAVGEVVGVVTGPAVGGNGADLPGANGRGERSERVPGIGRGAAGGDMPDGDAVGSNASGGGTPGTDTARCTTSSGGMPRAHATGDGPEGGNAPDRAGVVGSRRPNGGHGLIGMRERATLLGGTFAATAEAGVFQVRVCLPYDTVRAA